MKHHEALLHLPVHELDEHGAVDLAGNKGNIYPYKVVPQFGIAKLVKIPPNSPWFMVDISILTMAYGLWFINHLITGGHNLVYHSPASKSCFQDFLVLTCTLQHPHCAQCLGYF